jgi:hypothetical protein
VNDLHFYINRAGSFQHALTFVGSNATAARGSTGTLQVDMLFPTELVGFFHDLNKLRRDIRIRRVAAQHEISIQILRNLGQVLIEHDARIGCEREISHGMCGIRHDISSANLKRENKK